jgi:hypothetical protein
MVNTSEKEVTGLINDSNKIQQYWNLMEYVVKMSSLSTKLQRTPTVLDFPETMWKFRLRLA